MNRLKLWLRTLSKRLRSLPAVGRSFLHSPLALQLTTLSLLLMFITGFRPPYTIGSGDSFGYEVFGESNKVFAVTEAGFINNYTGVRTAGIEEIITEDEDGNKVVQIRKKQRKEVLEYTVRSGDNITKIAHKFGLRVTTLNWANGLTAKQTLDVGQTLRIPVVDGVFYTVLKNDTISDIAANHSIEVEKVYAYNQISRSKALSPGQELFLPEAKKVLVFAKPDPKPASTNTGNKDTPVTPGSNNNSTLSKPAVQPKPIPAVKPITPATRAQSQASGNYVGGSISSLGYRLRRPTKGILTQGYHRGHYALDIASAMNTPIYASAPGKVITSSNGWNYGYGNYIIVDHGYGVQTLYGHLNVRKVSVGQWVEAGQLIGLMGNTGRVFGRTGIHLHYEVRINGRKVNPNNYF